MPNTFEGWYFKQQSDQSILAIIPAIHMREHKRTGSIQVITPSRSFHCEFSDDDIQITRHPFTIVIGGSSFSEKGLDLDLKTTTITLQGRLEYGARTPIKGDIMGPFQFVPFMECRHSVFSLTHTVRGHLELNGESLDFSNGVGYMEGDRGWSFPKRYVWTQCNWFDAQPCSVMLSAAEVKPFGIPFTGIIGTVYFGGREYRIATYRGAKIEAIGNGAVSVRQDGFMLTAQLLAHKNQETAAQALRAPTHGEMVRIIKEHLTCTARYTFSCENKVLFDFVTDIASFEYEY